jgi:hypothetical protein
VQYGEQGLKGAAPGGPGGGGGHGGFRFQVRYLRKLLRNPIFLVNFDKFVLVLMSVWRVYSVTLLAKIDTRSSTRETDA